MSTERFRHASPELNPAVAGATPVAHPETQTNSVDPINARDLSLVAAIFTGHRTTLEINGLPVVDRTLNARLDEEIDPFIPRIQGRTKPQERVVGVRESLLDLREAALLKVVDHVTSTDEVSLPEELRGEAVREFLTHIGEFIQGDGNLPKLAALIKDPQKATALLHKSIGVVSITLPKLTSDSQIPTAVAPSFVSSRLEQ